MTTTDLSAELLSSVHIFSVVRNGGVLTREQLQSLLALAKERRATVDPRCFAAVVESHLRSLDK